jgi:hypothetical protein
MRRTLSSLSDVAGLVLNPRQLLESQNRTRMRPPNNHMELTPLCGPKIGAILKTRNSPSAFPIYRCGAAHVGALGRAPSSSYFTNIRLSGTLRYVIAYSLRGRLEIHSTNETAHEVSVCIGYD